MSEGKVEIECLDCEFGDSFPNLRTARMALDEHESETRHTVDWEIERVAGGVEQAGADAGVCGIPGLTNTESPLLDQRPADDE